MRRFLGITLLFSISLLTTHAQIASFGKEQPRSHLTVYPTGEAAAIAEAGNNRYRTRLENWTSQGNQFSTTFTVPFAWVNRQVILRIDRTSADCAISINGKKIGFSADGNAAAEFNITKAVNEGRNTLEINISSPSDSDLLESWKTTAQPSIGDVWVVSQPTLRIRDISTRTWIEKENPEMATTEISVAVKCDALNPRTSRLYYELLSRTGETVSAGFKEITIDMRHEDTLRILARIPRSHLWSAELPTQHTLKLHTQHEGRNDEFQEYRIGFRAFETKDGVAIINDNPVKLRTTEVSGTLSNTEVDALRAKGYNTLRLRPGYVAESLLDYCDAQGLYVIVTAPIDTRRSGTSRRKGGNPTNDPKWMQIYLERIANSYHAAKLHPSVIAFVMATQSANGINLYESYLKMKEFGDTRPFLYPDANGEWNTDKLVFE